MHGRVASWLVNGQSAGLSEVPTSFVSQFQINALREDWMPMTSEWQKSGRRFLCRFCLVHVQKVPFYAASQFQTWFVELVSFCRPLVPRPSLWPHLGNTERLL